MAPLTVESATAFLKFLEKTTGMAEFFTKISPDVKWTVANEIPTFQIAGKYESLAAFQKASSAIGINMATPWGLKLAKPPIVSADGLEVVAELRAINPETGEAPVGKNGVIFDNRYSWNMRWDSESEKIVEVRAYLDTALVRDFLA